MVRNRGSLSKLVGASITPLWKTLRRPAVTRMTCAVMPQKYGKRILHQRSALVVSMLCLALGHAGCREKRANVQVEGRAKEMTHDPTLTSPHSFLGPRDIEKVTPGISKRAIFEDIAWR